MGNEDKVSRYDVVKSRFLPPEIPGGDSGQTVYALDQEFSRTKKNVNPWFYVALIGFIAILATATILLTTWIERRNETFDAGLGDFEDTALKELLEDARNEEKALSGARAQLAKLKDEKKSKAEAIKSATRAEIEKISSSSLGRAERNTAIAEARAREKQQLEALDAEYREPIEKENTRVVTLQKRVDEKQAEISKGVDRADAVVSNYEELHNLKMEQQKAYYEGQIADLIAKYNPTFTTNPLKELSAQSDLRIYRDPVEVNYREVLERRSIMFRSEFDRMKSDIRSSHLLMSRLEEVPYINSVPGAIRRIDYLQNSVIGRYEQLWTGLAKDLENQIAINRSYDAAFQYLLDQEKESGFVIDGRDRSRIRVRLAKPQTAQPGSIAEIFRTDDEFIGVIELYRDGRELLGRVTSTADGKSPAPFDRLLIRSGNTQTE